MGSAARGSVWSTTNTRAKVRLELSPGVVRYRRSTARSIRAAPPAVPGPDVTAPAAFVAGADGRPTGAAGDRAHPAAATATRTTIRQSRRIPDLPHSWVGRADPPCGSRT